MATLSNIITKVRRITGRPSPSQLSDTDITTYVNTFYQYDFPEHLRLESLTYNYQFTTTANVPVYDFPTNLYLTVMPPVFIDGYQSMMTQSRQNFFRINPELDLVQQSIATGNGGNGPYTATLTNTPIIQGFKPNPPGAYSNSAVTDIAAQYLNWNVMITSTLAPNATSGIAPSITLIDDGQGNLFDPSDASTNPTLSRGSVNYITGACSFTFKSAVPSGNAINAHYASYGPARPLSVVFFQDQFILYPIPDQAYTVSFEAFKQPFSLVDSDDTPQLNEWWQLLAFGAAQKVFEDNGDFENMTKYRPLLDEQMRLALRRTIVQQTPERVATIYTDQNPYNQWPFGIAPNGSGG